MTASPDPPPSPPGPAFVEERVALGDGHMLRFQRFGDPDARPKVYLQAGLHADELPGMLVLQRLSVLLEECVARGTLIGQVVMAPVANPIGLSQQVGEMLVGRADLVSGRNFNRGFMDLAAAVKDRLVLGADAETNIARVRAAMGDAIRAQAPNDPLAVMQHALLSRAYDADIALDLHADNEALIHLYAVPQLWPDLHDLAAEIDARAVLLCEACGSSPFDEALSTPWLRLAQAFPDAALPVACRATTVELRSNDAVDERLADRDAAALLRFLKRRGVVAGEAGGLPRFLGKATDLVAMQQLKAPIAGLVVYKAQLGDTVRSGDVVAEIVPETGPRAVITAATDGLLFARHSQRFAWAGRIVGKIAGETPLPDRVGDLLSP